MASEDFDFSAYFQAVFIPKQRPPPDPLPPGTIMASVSTYPPLGQITQLKTGHVTFVAVLEVGEARANDPWEVALWQSSSVDGSREWTEHSVSPTASDRVPSTLQASSGRHRLYYSEKLSVKPSLKFTVKFRSGPDQPWRWIQDEAGMGDGVVIVNENLDQKDARCSLPDLIHRLNRDFEWKQLTSQSPGTHLWSIVVPVSAAKGEDSKILDTPLGIPWGGCLR
jgi:hypothetical protein